MEQSKNVPLNLWGWIKEVEEQMKPPVCNKMIFQQSKDFIVMAVKGPNTREDFHVNATEEVFYQLKGDIYVHTQEEGKKKTTTIKEGEIFLLPGGVPHSPERPEGTVGIVIEKVRRAEEQDGFQWYCKECNHKLHEKFLHVSDIVKDLPPVFQEYESRTELSTCSRCGFNNKT